MSELGRPFLHPDVRRLIEDDRLAPDPPDAVKQKVARRLDRSLELGGAMLGALPALNLQPVPLADAPSLVPPPPASLFGWKAVAGVALSAVVGGVAVLALAARMPSAPAPRSGGPDAVVHETPAAPVAGGASALFGSDVDSTAPNARRGVSVNLNPPAASEPRRSRTAPKHASARGVSRQATSSRGPGSGSIDTLAAERTVLDGARAALVRRDGPAALSALRSHEQAFVHGQLLEERESMRVQALGLVRDFDGARAAADRFRRHFPRSMFLPAVEQALETAP